MITAKFENIGPIHQAELELGDLTIIAGQNNTGKTYLVYTLYGFLNILQNQDHDFLRRSSYLLHNNKTLDEQLGNLVTQIQDTGKGSMAVTDYKRFADRLLKEQSKFFSRFYLTDVFSTLNGEFENAKFEMKMDDADYEDESLLRVSKRRGVSLNSMIQNNELIFELDNSSEHSIGNRDITMMLLLWMMRSRNRKYPKPFILSAERFGISLFYKELDFTKNRLVEELQKLSDGKRSSKKRIDPFRFLEKGSSRYAQPIKDNIDFTRYLPDIQKYKSEIHADKTRSVDAMMDGYYKAENDEIRFISRRRGDSRFNIPLHLASSSTRGLSDLYFYLKHVAKPNQLLIIDEPESHLSPTNQVLMARLLAFCVNAGLKVLITTHSDYLIKEINNLIMLNGNFEGKEKFLKQHKKDYRENDYLKPESVKAYTSRDGGLTPCEVDDQGIDMPVFDDAINNINKISNTLSFLKLSNSK